MQTEYEDLHCGSAVYIQLGVACPPEPGLELSKVIICCLSVRIFPCAITCALAAALFHHLRLLPCDETYVNMLFVMATWVDMIDVALCSPRDPGVAVV